MTHTPIFDFSNSLWQAIGGKDLEKFTFQNAPLSTSAEAIFFFFLYLAVVLGGRELMNKHVEKPIRLPTVFFWHNAILSIASAWLLAAFLESVLPMWYQHGFFYAICDKDAWTQKLEVLYYINYLFKYWELADTMFLVLKKKPLEFLHVYHHGATMVLCFVELHGTPSVSWAIISLNLTVHVIMYYYYACMALPNAKPIWWKKYLTTMQIIQFIIDLGLVWFCVGTYHAYKDTPNKYFPYKIPTYGTCAGTEFAAWTGCFVLSSYLVLFVQFFIKTYHDKKAVAAKKAAAAAKSD